MAVSDDCNIDHVQPGQQLAKQLQTAQLDCATKLDLSSNNLADLPAAVCNLTSLQDLNLASNCLQQLPRCAYLPVYEACSMHQRSSPCDYASPLTHHISPGTGSASMELQDGMLACRCTLCMAANALLCNKADIKNSARLLPVCSAIGHLTQLRFLNAMNNRLTTLPRELCQMPNLYRLGLKCNELTALPDSIGQLTSLVELFLTKNELCGLPDSIGGCSSLVKLQVSS